MKAVYIVSRCQDLDMCGEAMEIENEIVKVFSTRKLANEYVRKHENITIPEEDQNPDYEYNECTYDYSITRRSVK